MFAAMGVTGLNQFASRPSDIINVPGVNLLVGDGLSSSHVNEYVLGVGGTVGSNLVYRVDGVRRVYKDFYTTRRNLATGQVTDSLGNVFDLGFLVNSNLPEREYTGLHSSLSFRTGSLNLAANWTWSHMIGNFIGETSGSGPVTSGYENYPEYIDLAWNATARQHAPGPDAPRPASRVPTTSSSDSSESHRASSRPGTPEPHTGPRATSTAGPLSRTPATLPRPRRLGTTSRAGTPTGPTDIWRTDLSLVASAKLGPVEIFVAPQILNLFNNSAIVTPEHLGLGGDRRDGERQHGPHPVRPVHDDADRVPADRHCGRLHGAGRELEEGPELRQTRRAPRSYQIPRVWTVSLGVRF